MKPCHFVSSLMSSLLTPLWNNSVKIINQVATQHQQQEGLMVFSQRLLYTLQVGPQSAVSFSGFLVVSAGFLKDIQSS